MKVKCSRKNDLLSISTMGFYHKEKIIGELPEEKALRDSMVSNMVLVSPSLPTRNKDSLK